MMQLLIRQRGRREKCQLYCDARSLNRDDAVVGGGLWDGGGNSGREEREKEVRGRNVPICHTSNGALLKLHHVTGQGSSFVRENVFYLYREWGKKSLFENLLWREYTWSLTWSITSYTWPNSSLRLEVRAIAGVFVGSYSISVS